ncbi:MAG: hypothetical protein JSS83_15655 [Cyanobacteria bacterium SZAS LIN-3]|nr:hypothetical protein [Cyanobacteria bacterium SZAS LIN-3]
MTSICCVGDILKPFQGVLRALSKRQGSAVHEAEETPPATDENAASANINLKSMRAKASREFHVWDRVKETVTTPGRLSADMQQLASAVIPIENEKEELEPLPDTQQLARERTALARAKTTHSRLKSLEVYLNQSPSPVKNGP